MEYKGFNLIIKPSFFRPFGPLYNSAQAIYPFIFIPSYIAKNLNLTEYKAVLEHEIVHLNRARKKGLLIWYPLYIISGSFRLKEEVIAYLHKKIYLESQGEVFDIEKHAMILSGPIYGRMVSFEEACTLLKKSVSLDNLKLD